MQNPCKSIDFGVSLVELRVPLGLRSVAVVIWRDVEGAEPMQVNFIDFGVSLVELGAGVLEARGGVPLPSSVPLCLSCLIFFQSQQTVFCT